MVRVFVVELRSDGGASLAFITDPIFHFGRCRVAGFQWGDGFRTAIDTDTIMMERFESWISGLEPTAAPLPMEVSVAVLGDGGMGGRDAFAHIVFQMFHRQQTTFQQEYLDMAIPKMVSARGGIRYPLPKM